MLLPSSDEMNSNHVFTSSFCSDTSPIVAITNGLERRYFPARMLSSKAGTPLSDTALTVSSTTSRETYPIAPGVDATFARTAPVVHSLPASVLLWKN